MGQGSDQGIIKVYFPAPPYLTLLADSKAEK